MDWLLVGSQDSERGRFSVRKDNLEDGRKVQKLGPYDKQSKSHCRQSLSRFWSNFEGIADLVPIAT